MFSQILPWRRERSSFITLGRVCVALICPPVLATPSTFDLEAFSGGGTPGVDISRFNRRNSLAPGKYRVDLLVNGHNAGRHELDLVSDASQEGAVPCLGWPFLDRLGIAPTALGADAMASQCVEIDRLLPMASSTFDPAALALSISVPQAYMKVSARGAVDPSQWDEGIDAGLLSYNFSTSTVTRGEGTDRAYLGLNGGVNLGAWRLRHQGAQSWDSQQGAQPYQHTATYLQRSVAQWQSRLTLGDTFSSGQILDSTRMRGISLGTDDQMLAQSRQGYAPVVRGTAASNATVNVSQNGYTIYETTVAPGPFVIDDLYPTGVGGDLSVTVTEIDGRRQRFTVPFSVAPQLLRSGASRYAVTLGQVRQNGVQGAAPLAAQATLQHGLLDNLTLYGGGSAAEGYLQTKAGVALGTEWGAFSVDATDSRTRVPGHGQLSGQTLGLGYNKNLTQSGTHFVLGAYRFSTADYLNLTDAMNVRELGRNGADIAGYARQKSRVDFTISQQLGRGALGFYLSSTDYWGARQGRETALNLSYGSSWRKVNWTLSAQRSRIEAGRERTQREHSDQVFFGSRGTEGRVDNRLMLALSMPLGGGNRAPSLSSSLSGSTGQGRGSQQQLGVNGLFDEQGSLSYGVSGSRSMRGGQSEDSFNAYAGYHASTANVRAGYGQGGSASQLSFSADGGLIAHQGGVTFSHYLGEAAALVQVPDAQGARLSQDSNVRVDRHGYAVVPSLRAYQPNTVGIDPQGSAEDVELKEATQHVVPTLGAVSRVRFDTVVGRAVVLKALRQGGQPLPFAAQVFDEQGSEVGVIGQASKAFVRGIADTGTLTVKWSENPGDRCYIHYQLPPRNAGLRQARADLMAGQCIAITNRYEVSKR